MSIALENELKPLHRFLQTPGVTEISINKPTEVFIEDAGSITRHIVPELTFARLMSLATLIASQNGQSINEKTTIGRRNISTTRARVTLLFTTTKFCLYTQLLND